MVGMCGSASECKQSESDSGRGLLVSSEIASFSCAVMASVIRIPRTIWIVSDCDNTGLIPVVCLMIDLHIAAHDVTMSAGSVAGGQCLCCSVESSAEHA